MLSIHLYRIYPRNEINTISDWMLDTGYWILDTGYGTQLELI